MKNIFHIQFICSINILFYKKLTFIKQGINIGFESMFIKKYNCTNFKLHVAFRIKIRRCSTDYESKRERRIPPEDYGNGIYPREAG